MQISGRGVMYSQGDFVGAQVATGTCTTRMLQSSGVDDSPEQQGLFFVAFFWHLCIFIYKTV